jgi:hypothetical protein
MLQQIALLATVTDCFCIIIHLPSCPKIVQNCYRGRVSSHITIYSVVQNSGGKKKPKLVTFSYTEQEQRINDTENCGKKIERNK